MPKKPRKDRIVKKGAQYCAVSKDGTKSFGCFSTRDKAVKRLREVEFFKNRGDSSPRRVERIDRLGVLHCEKGRLDGVYLEETPEGFLRCDGLLTRTGVFEYCDAEGDVWGEYRDPEEVFDSESLKSFEMVVITDDHPDDMVNAENIRDLQVGHVGSDVRQEGDFVRADLLITDPDVIARIRDGKVELSCGYTAEVFDEPGVAPDGTPYTYRQRTIRGNHLALVDQGRAGPLCRLQLDGAAITTGVLMTVKNKKKDKKVMVGGQEHDVPDAVAEAFSAMQAKMEEQAAELAKLGSSEDAEDTEDVEEGSILELLAKEGGEPEMETDQDIEDLAVNSKDEETMKSDSKAMSAMKAKIDALEATIKDGHKTETVRIDARVNLVATVREVVGSDSRTDGVSDLALQKAVVSTVKPSFKGKLDQKSPDYIKALYDMAVEDFRNRVDSSGELLEVTTQVHEDAVKFDVDSAYDSYVKNLSRNARGVVKEH